jgi:acyl-coenzyme A synthetase/AMP-(fatty) acid ligase
VPREIAIGDELPRSNGGKILRDELRAGGVSGDGN